MLTNALDTFCTIAKNSQDSEIKTTKRDKEIEKEKTFIRTFLWNDTRILAICETIRNIKILPTIVLRTVSKTFERTKDGSME